MPAFDPVKSDSRDASAWDADDGAVVTQLLDEGDANAAVSTTDTTLTDTREAWDTDQWVNYIVTAGGKTMTVTSNTATVLTGASWSGGGNPGNGTAWKIDLGVTDDDTGTSVVKQGKAPNDIVKTFFDIDPTGLETTNTITVHFGMSHNYGTMALLPYDAANSVLNTNKLTYALSGGTPAVFTFSQAWIDDLFDQGDLGTVSGRTNSFAVRIVEDLEINGDLEITEIDSVLSEAAAADAILAVNLHRVIQEVF